jgi:hypothetical protein
MAEPQAGDGRSFVNLALIATGVLAFLLGEQLISAFAFGLLITGVLFDVGFSTSSEPARKGVERHRIPYVSTLSDAEFT